MIHEVIKNLYVGDENSFDTAKERGCVIVSCCKDGPHSHRQMLGYHTMAAPKGENYYLVERPRHMGLNLIDTDNPNFIPKQVILPAVQFIYKHHNAGEKVFVHCNAGHSRSPSTTLMYLRSVGEMPSSFIQSEKVFRTLYPKYDPAIGIRQFARSHWAELENKNAQSV